MMAGVITPERGLFDREGRKREVDQNTRRVSGSARGTGNYSCRTYLRGSSVQVSGRIGESGSGREEDLSDRHASLFGANGSGIGSSQ